MQPVRLTTILGITCVVSALSALLSARYAIDTATHERLRGGPDVWMEVRDAIVAGKTTVIVPTGGTEQNGPHMAIGKHNYLVRYKAGEVARQLGNALVAPVVAYVPEGEIDPPTGHMRFAGTVTTPQDVFVKVLEYAARSFKRHGFLDIALLGDSGGNQAGQQLVTDALNKEWAATNARVHHLSAYYPGRGDAWVESQGVAAADVGSHAGTHDTSSLMYLNPSMLRFDRMGPGSRETDRATTATPRRRRRSSASAFWRCRSRTRPSRFRRCASAVAADGRSSCLDLFGVRENSGAWIEAR